MTAPIYRAKKIDSGEYIFGYLCVNNNGKKQIQTVNFKYYEIDITTLSIYLGDTEDRRVNRVFASLREDGKGGDILYGNLDYEESKTIIFADGSVRFGEHKLLSELDLEFWSVIGIQK